METRTYGEKQIIFRQGEPGREMFDIVSGSVGIYMNYGQPGEKLLSTLRSDASFGEMALLDEETCSATAVALEAGTKLAVITAGDFSAYFESRPAKVLAILQQLSGRLRGLTRDYLGACETVTKAAEAMEAGREYPPELAERVRHYARQAAEG